MTKVSCFSFGSQLERLNQVVKLPGTVQNLVVAHLQRSSISKGRNCRVAGHNGQRSLVEVVNHVTYLVQWGVTFFGARKSISNKARIRN